MSFVPGRDSVSGARRQGSGSSQPAQIAPWSPGGGSQPTSTRVQASSPAVGWPTSPSPTQAVYPLQGSLSPQGSAPWSTTSSGQSTSDRVPPPPPIGWSTSSGPTQAVYPLQGSLSPQGSAPWSTTTSGQSTSDRVPPPLLIGRSTSSGPTQGVYPLQGSLSPQGRAPWSATSSSGQSTSDRVPPPPPISWSTSSGSTQGAYPLQGSLSPQGSSPQQDNFTRPENGVFSGGYMQQGHATSPSASAFTRSNSISHTNAFASRGSQFIPPHLQHNEAFNWFVAIDQDGNGELSPEELQSALLNNGGTRFSTKTIKYLMSVFDLDGNGVIGFDEFEPLWDHMKRWRELFESFDADNNGRIDVNELGNALTNYGLVVGSSILELLMKKYGITPSQNRYPGYGYPPRPHLDLDHFVCALVVVESMCRLYDEYYARGSGPRQLSRDGFLLQVISLP